MASMIDEYFEYIERLLNIDIIFDIKPTFENDSICGKVIDGKIIINIKWLNNTNNEAFLAFLSHEAFHLFQKEYIKSHNNELSIKWENEFNNYINPTDDNFEIYFNQSIERTATAFSALVIKKFTNNNLEASKLLKDEDYDIVKNLINI